MDYQNTVKYKKLFIAGAVIITLLQILDIFDFRNIPYDGYTTDGNHTVIRVHPNSPAQKAGFLVGDIMVSDGGIDVKNNQTLARRPRVKIGETGTYVFDRDGEAVSLNLVFTDLPSGNLVRLFAGVIIGLCFLIFGLYAYLRVQNKSTTLLALVGVCLGFSYVHGPYISSYLLRMIYSSIEIITVIFGLAFLLHFMLMFPKAKAVLEKKYMRILLYGPVALAGLFLLFIDIFLLDSSNTFYGILVGLVLLGYLGLAIVAMVHSFIKATPEERTSHGLKFMLFGTILGFMPIVIIVIFRFIAPHFVLPGSDFYFLSMVLIPGSWALAVLKKETKLAPSPTKG